MRVIRQPKGSRCCGQACLAMLFNVPLEESISWVGKKGSTRTKDLIKVFKGKGYYCGDRLERTFEGIHLPSICILRIKWPDTYKGHWVVYKDGYIYCSVIGKYKYEGLVVEGYKEVGRITSYLNL